MDTHIPVILSNTTTSIAAMYADKLAPEQNYNYPPFPISALLEDAWMARKTNYKPKSPEDKTIKLLKKVSAPPPMRFTSKQLINCAQSTGEANYTARTIALLHMLGLYPGRKHMLPPEERYNLYSMNTLDLCLLLISTHVPKEINMVVATFMVWATKGVPPLWEFCKREYGHRIKRVMTLDIEYDRIILPDHPKDVGPSRLVSVPEYFIAALDVKKKIPVWVQEMVRTEVDMELCFKLGCSSEHITVGMLTKAGIPLHAARSLVVCVSSKHEANSVVRVLQKADQCRLYLILLAMITRRDTYTRPLSMMVTNAQKKACTRTHGSTEYYAAICIACSTWRPKCKRISALSKATCGILLSFEDNTIACNACGANWSICMVDMVGRIMVSRLRLASEPQDITLCVSCAQPTSPINYLGVMPYCTTCYIKKKAEYTQPRICIICRVDIKAGSGQVFDCYSKVRDQQSVLSLCNKHKKYANNAIDILIEEDFTEMSKSILQHSSKLTGRRGGIVMFMPNERQFKSKQHHKKKVSHHPN